MRADGWLTAGLGTAPGQRRLLAVLVVALVVVAASHTLYVVSDYRHLVNYRALADARNSSLAAAALGDYVTGVLRDLQRFAANAGPLLERLAGGSPDAADRRRLADELSRQIPSAVAAGVADPGRRLAWSSDTGVLALDELGSPRAVQWHDDLVLFGTRDAGGGATITVAVPATRILAPLARFEVQGARLRLVPDQSEPSRGNGAAVPGTNWQVFSGVAPAPGDDLALLLRIVLPLLVIGAALVVPLLVFTSAQARRLAASEARFSRFFENGEDPVVVLDLAGRTLVDANQRFAQLRGAPFDVLLGKPFAGLLAEGDGALQRFLDEVEQQGSAWTADLRLRAADETVLRTEIAATLNPRDPEFVLVRVRNVDDHKRIERAVYELAQSSAGLEDEDFLRACVRSLASACRCRWALAGIFDDDTRTSIRTLALWDGDGFCDNIVYPLAGSPCGYALASGGNAGVAIGSGVRERFPEDPYLVQMGVESYVGAPLADDRGEPLGIVVVMDSEPMPHSRLTEPFVGIYANRLAQEMVRRRALLDLRESEQNYRDLIDGSVQGIMIHRDWQPVYVNPRCLEMFGYDDIGELFALDSLRPLFAEDEYARLERYRTSRMHGEAVPDQYEVNALRKDGSRMVVHCVARLTRWNGEPAIQSTYLDVTERKRVEAALRESETNFRRLTEGVIEAIMIYRDLRPLYVNPPFASMLGYSVEELLGFADVRALYPEHVWERARELLAHPPSEGSRPASYTLQMRHRDGRPIDVQVRGMGSQWSGEPALQVTMIDITEKRHSESTLQLLHAFSSQQGMSFEQRIGALLQAGCRHFALPLGFLARVRGEAIEIEYSVSPDERLGPGAELRLDAGGAASLAADTPLLVHDSRAGASPWTDALGASACIALRVRDTVYGVLVFAAPEPLEHPFRASDARVLGLMGSWVAAEIARGLDERARIESEQRFRDFAETSADWFWETDASGGLRFFEGKYEHLGADPHEIVGIGRRDDAPGELRQAIGERRVFTDLPNTWLGPDGEARILANSGKPVYDERGTFRGYRGAGRDITGQVQTQKAIKISEERFRQFASIAADWFWEMDVELRFTYVSGNLARATGLDHNDFIGKTHAQCYADRRVTETAQWREHEEQVQARLPYAMKIETCRADGGPLIVYHQGTPVFDEARTFRGYRGIGRDITDRVITERELEKYRHSLESLVSERTRELEATQKELLQQERLATIGRLVATVSHELRNPLGAVRNAAYYLQRKAPANEPRWRQQLDVIEKEINSADKIIGDLLETTRAKLPVIQDVNLSSLIRQVFESCAGEQDIVFEYHADPVDLLLAADLDHLRQVLINLVTNSVQATGPGGRVAVAAYQEGEWNVITVSDNGPGVAAEHREQVFEPLFTTKSKGNGLGLWICREIVERHGGSLKLSGDSEGGATFTMRLPSRPDVGVLAAAG